MKTFAKLLSEVAEPKAGDEKHFKDKHITVKKDHPVAGDNVFKGGTKKAPKRLADHEAGEDAEVYEGLDPVNKKSAMGKFKDRADKDINNDGDVDSSDKYLHARRNAITKAVHKEEAENLDEISRDLARSYIRKASDQFHGEKNRLKLGDKAKKRSAGITMAGKKAYSIPSEPRVRATESVEQVDEVLKPTSKMGTWIKDFQKSDAPQFKGKSKEKRRQMAIAAKYGAEREAGMREEVEQIDELSKKTLSSYTRKAAASMGTAAHDLGQKKAAADEVDRMTNRNMPNKYAVRDQMKKALGVDHDAQSKDQNTIGKRLKGIDRATARLAKEEAELEEKLIGGQKKLDHNKNGKIDAHDFHLMRKKKMKEEAEQLDELSPNKLHAYIKGASADMKKHASMAGYDSRSRAYNNAAKNAKLANKRLAGITSASGRLADKANMAENAWEEVPMMMRQLQFIMFAAEELMDYLDTQVDPEEWFQNKLAHIHDQMQTLQAYAEGDMRMMSRMGGMYGEGVELDESITKMSHGRLKFHLNTNTPHGSYSNDEMKAERDRRLKAGEGQAYRAAKAGLSEATPSRKALTRALQGMKVQPKEKVSLKKAPWEKNEEVNEVTQSAVKKTITYTGSDGKSHTRNVPIKRIDRDEHGQDKIRESVELDEMFKAGSLKLKDGSSVTVKKEEANLLNKMFEQLSGKNREKMESTLMGSKKGFTEILSFAKEAL